MAEKTAEYYRGLPYSRRVRLEEGETGAYFVAFIVELDGVETDGADPPDALSNLQSAFEDYLAAMLEWGNEIPEPVLWPESLGWDPAAPARDAEVQAVTIEAFEAKADLDEEPWSLELEERVFTGDQGTLTAA